jgi:hypothetical protein
VYLESAFAKDKIFLGLFEDRKFCSCVHAWWTSFLIPQGEKQSEKDKMQKCFVYVE